MGAFSTNVPCLLDGLGTASRGAPSRADASARAPTCGVCGTERRAGELTDEQWAISKPRSPSARERATPWAPRRRWAPSAEALGLAWPGSTSIPAGDPRHRRRRAAASASASSNSRDVRRHDSRNRSRQHSIGNALVAPRRHRRLDERRDPSHRHGASTRATTSPSTTIDRVGRNAPVLVDVEPSGSALMEDLDAAGGFPTVFGALGDLARTATSSSPTGER